MSEQPQDFPFTFKQFRDLGLLWLFNTTALHPRGYALAFHWADGDDPETADPIGWSIMGDGTEPWTFGDAPDTPEHRTLDALFAGVRELLYVASRSNGDQS